jgi:hypothetical protein
VALFSVRLQQIPNDLANYFPGLVVQIGLSYRSVPMLGDHFFGSPYDLMFISWQMSNQKNAPTQ